MNAPSADTGQPFQQLESLARDMQRAAAAMREDHGPSIPGGRFWASLAHWLDMVAARRLSDDWADIEPADWNSAVEVSSAYLTHRHELAPGTMPLPAPRPGATVGS